MVRGAFGRSVRLGRRGALLVLGGVVLSGAAFAVRPAAAEVRWRSGARSAPHRMQPAELREAAARLAARPGRTHAVVHFDGPLDAARRHSLQDDGVRLLGYLGENAYFCSLARNLDAERLASVPGVKAIEAIATENKLHPDLARGIVHPWAVVGRPQSDPLVAVYVMFHRDVDLATTAPAVIGRHGGEIRSYLRSIHGVVAHLAASRVTALADEDAVMWVEPPLPPWRGLNDGNRARVGADTLQDAPYGLTGAGVTVLVYDGGQVFAHGDLAGRLTVGASDTSTISDHSTHVAGTIGGDGAGSGGQYRGMAPAVEIVSYGYEQPGGLQQGFLYTDPGDLEADYTEAITVYGADISNDSIGTNTASNGFPCDWEGNYGATGALIDEIARGSTGAPFRIVWANGNERSSGACGTTYHTTAPPACAKNHITVGALNSNDDSVTSFTSWGPCDDGRLKPDVSAPGCENGNDGGVTSLSSSGGYTVKCGTSMASPTVAGIGALLLERYRAVFPGQPDPRNATLKAILAETAQDLLDPGPDFQTGYGSVRAVPAADLIAEQRFIEAEVGQGDVYTFIVLVGAGDPQLKVTVAWDDPAGTPDVNPVLVNDLDLRVIDPGGTTHYPWTLDPDNPADPAVRTQRDGLNNIEQVVIDAPAPGAYRVEIEGFNVAEGPTQSFGAAASPTLINCAPSGTLSTSTGRISCSDDLGIQVIDCDLNTDDNVVDTTTVAVVSPSEPAGETVTLTETAAESAQFQGSIPVSTSDAPGVLAITEGETITVTYIDADDGAGGTNVPVTRDVVVDCTPPVITGVTVSNLKPREATLSVTADEPVRLTVPYGTVCGAPTDTATALALATAHDVQLQGLTDDTVYFYTIEAQDEAGNATVDDNGGACFTFATPEIPDFFTEQFTSGIDLAGMSMTFTPNATIDLYAVCVEPLFGGLPTDPTGGTNLGLSDDQPGSFTLAGGATVSLYDTAYDTVWVGPNGYLTFGSGDSTYTETLTAHFSKPRVAAVFDDLNPSAGGAVTWKQLSDRVAVTWEGVPEYSTTNSNTFQIEMFFDGRIRMSWQNLDSGDAITGLSQGTGLDPDFLASDLSAGPSCGPRPPYAQNLGVQTAVGTPMDVTLVAADDGLPAPPSLTYRIASLPTLGTLTDTGTGSPIIAVPHDLAAGGSSVTYTPLAGYQGPDAFTYRADDGGEPPDGGESDPATVSVAVGGPQALYEFLVDDTDPGWTTTGGWAFGAPTGAGSHDLDPVAGATGSNVYGYNLTGDYPDNMGPEYLTSLPVDLSGVSGTAIEFQRWLAVESASYDHATFQISTDGSSWTTLWDHTGGAVSESSWSLHGYDVSSIADGQPAVQFRWIMGPTDVSVTYPGWNIDDVRITGTVPVPCSGVPGEVPNVSFSADRRTLQWTPASYPGGSAPVYDTIRSTDPTDFGAGAVCIETDDGSDTLADDPEDPVGGVVFYYLIRAENDCGVGSPGSGRTARSCASGP